MKFFDEPKVYLISKPQLHWSGIQKFMEQENLSWKHNDIDHSDGDLLPEFAGRICYVSFGQKQGRKRNDEYIKNILSMGHGSVLEHSNYTFLVTNASRGFTHEMVRHRAGFAYSQESTHYINYLLDDAKVLIPHHKDLDGCDDDIYRDSYTTSIDAYNKAYDGLRDSGVSKKDACSLSRPLLPIGIESKLVFTANIRSLRHFMQTRGNAHNVDEIRLVAVKVLKVMQKEAPNCFHDMKIIIDADDKEVIQSTYKKV